MKRREFLNVVGTGAAAIAAFSCRDREEAARIAAGRDGPADADLTWHKAPCRYCGTGCGVEVGVRDGRPVCRSRGEPVR